jgi:hypothetical protein
MNSPQTRLRLKLAVPYWIIASLALFAIYRGDSFCPRPGSRNFVLMVLQLSLALAMWDLVVGFAGSFAFAAVGKMSRMNLLGQVLTTLVVAAGFAYLPFWIYAGYGVFRFGNTWADVSCFFTEGYAFEFLFAVTPLLALMTFLREILILRLIRQRA